MHPKGNKEVVRGKQGEVEAELERKSQSQTQKERGVK